jgi:hypothetical protein
MFHALTACFRRPACLAGFLLACLAAVARADEPAAPLPSLPAESQPAAQPVIETASASAAPAPSPTPDMAPTPAETQVLAQTALPATGSAPEKPTPSRNTVVNLLNLMVKRGLISKEDASGLISQAEQEAATAPGAPAPAAASVAAADGSLAADTVRVTYVPDTVRQQMTDEIKQDVLTQARDERWANPRAYPDWLSRFSLFGDIRFRYQGDFFPSGNDTTGTLVNYNAINTGSPVNANANGNAVPLPSYNADQDRERLRLRARVGADLALDGGFSAGVRVGTGSDDSPGTENQTLGGANGQGGYFGKYQIWLDRAFIKWDLDRGAPTNLSFTVGRFDNPFFSTSMIWADDIAFDGVAVQGKYQVAEGLTPFFNGGAFPIYNTAFNYGEGGAKLDSYDKWLYGAQAGLEWKVNKDITVRAAAAFYDFENIEGELSTPITQDTFVADPGYVGDTDASRPSFAQNGNTYMPIRNIISDGTATPQYEYYGLATAFREMALTGQVDYRHFDPFDIKLTGEFVSNLAFDRSAISALAANNQNADGVYDGGNLGWYIRMNFGAPALVQRWDWNIAATYRYVQSDATVDAFTDADFGGALTGTNLKGYTLSASVALSQRVWTTLSWMSSDSIAGPLYREDLLQFDVNAKF